MTLLFTPLTGLAPTQTVSGSNEIPVLTEQGFKLASLNLLYQFITADIIARLTALEAATSGPGSDGNTTTPSTLALSGAVEGSVLLDSATTIQLNTTIPLGSLTFAHIATLTEWAAGVDSTLSGHTASLGELATRTAAVETGQTNHETRIAALEAAPSGGTDLTAVNTQLADHTGRISILEASQDSQDLTLQTLSDHISAHDARLGAVETSAAAAATQNDLVALTNRVSTAEGEVDALQLADDGHNTRLTALETTDADHATRLTAAETGQANHETRIVALENAGSVGGGGSAGSFDFTRVTTTTLMTPKTPYLADAIGGSFDLTLPSNLQIGDWFTVWVVNGAVNIISGANVIRDVGAGNDLGLVDGEVVTLLCIGVNELAIS